jgi:Uma2 family endonuclease
MTRSPNKHHQKSLDLGNTEPQTAAAGCYNPAVRLSAKFTYDDLQHIPPDHNLYEIVDGDLFATPAHIPLHQRVVGNLLAELRLFVRKHRLGEVLVAPCDVVLSPLTVLEPDLLFISQSRRHIVGPKNIKGPPDLVVEVFSESTAHVDRNIKPKTYSPYGVPELWLIDPESTTMEIFRLRDGGYELSAQLVSGQDITSPLLPGFRLPLDSLWES